jgi:hypothetical protein
VYGGTAFVLDALRGEADGGGTAAPVGAPLGPTAARLADGSESIVLAGFDTLVGGDTEPPSAIRAADGWRLTGRVTVDDVGLPAPACCLPVSAGDTTVLVVLPAPVWAARARPLFDSLGLVELNDVHVADDAIVGSLGPGRPPRDPNLLLARGRVRAAAYLIGLAEGAHELAAAHAARRHQFGRPILDFQGVAFPLAQGLIALTAARTLLWRATWLADSGATLHREAAEALAFAGDVALRVIGTAVQVHGARGMATEQPVHAHLRTLRTALTRLGPPSPLWREAGAMRLLALAKDGPAC